MLVHCDRQRACEKSDFYRYATAIEPQARRKGREILAEVPLRRLTLLNLKSLAPRDM